MLDGFWYANNMRIYMTSLSYFYKRYKSPDAQCLKWHRNEEGVRFRTAPSLGLSHSQNPNQNQSQSQRLKPMQICKYCFKARDSTRFLVRLLLSSSRLGYFYGLLRLPCGGSEHSVGSLQSRAHISGSVSVEKRNRNLYEKCKFRCLLGTIDNCWAMLLLLLQKGTAIQDNQWKKGQLRIEAHHFSWKNWKCGRNNWDKWRIVNVPHRSHIGRSLRRIVPVAKTKTHLVVNAHHNRLSGWLAKSKTWQFLILLS